MRGIEWEHIWGVVAADLDESWAVGLGHLVTEDVLRFATSKALVGGGVKGERLQNEWRRPGVPDAVDLVVATEPGAAIEFKYPREPREKNAAWTQHLGELLKDFYRLAYMPEGFEQRWCVQLLTPRVQQYLAGVGDRHRVCIALEPGRTTGLDPQVVRALPATATAQLARWLAHPEPVVATCIESRQVGQLALVVHAVSPSATRTATESGG
ncbi:MAG: hypothetical protein WA991_12285 [Ornithinimicrobium sp.]